MTKQQQTLYECASQKIEELQERVRELESENWEAVKARDALAEEVDRLRMLIRTIVSQSPDLSERRDEIHKIAGIEG